MVRREPCNFHLTLETLGLGNLVYAAGAAVGGPLGGWLGDTIGWRWAFLIQGEPSTFLCYDHTSTLACTDFQEWIVPICFLHFGVVSWKVNIPSGPGSVSEKIKRIDFLGALSMVSAVSLLLVGLSMGGKFAIPGASLRRY